MRLRDFFENYYSNGQINIVRIECLGWYFLMGNTGGIADRTVVYKFDKSTADKLISGRLKITDIIKDSRSGLVLDNYERCFSAKDLEEIAAMSSGGEQKKTK